MTEHIKIYGVKPRIQYVADGELRTYDFPFATFKASDIEVYLQDIKQASNTYSVLNAGSSDGGSIVFVSAPSSGTVITIMRNLSIERTSDFQEGSSLRAKVLNDELDYQIACQQQIADHLNRSMVLPPYATDNDLDLTLPTPLPGKAIIWNSDGTNLENSTIEVNALESTLKGYKTTAETAASTATAKAQIASDKADIATEKAAEAVATVSGKATKDMDNLSITGKEKICNLSMPDYSSCLSQSNNTEYISQTNGWLEIYTSCWNSNTPCTLTLNGVSKIINSGATSSHLNNDYSWVPVPKGVTYKITLQRTGMDQFINFYPCMGG